MSWTQQQRRTITAGIIVFTTIIWAALDLFAVTAWGVDTSISWVMADYLARARWSITALAYGMGLLTPHLLGWSQWVDRSQGER